MYDALDKSVGYLTVSPGWNGKASSKSLALKHAGVEVFGC